MYRKNGLIIRNTVTEYMTELNAGIRGLSGSLNHQLLRFFPNKVASDEKQNGFKDKVKDIVAQALPQN
jgi:hypothetical protein